MSTICQAGMKFWEYNDEQDVGLSLRSSQPSREIVRLKRQLENDGMSIRVGKQLQ